MKTIESTGTSRQLHPLLDCDPPDSPTPSLAQLYQCGRPLGRTQLQS